MLFAQQILERHVEMLIACHSWQEVPLILSVTLNHLVRGEEQEMAR